MSLSVSNSVNNIEITDHDVVQHVKKELYKSFGEEIKDTSFPNLISFFNSFRGENVDQKTSSAKQSVVSKFKSKEINETELKKKMEQIAKLNDFFNKNENELNELHALYKGNKISLEKHEINSDEWFYLRLTTNVVPFLKDEDQDLQDIVTPSPLHSINEKRESSIPKTKDESCQIM